MGKNTDCSAVTEHNSGGTQLLCLPPMRSRQHHGSGQCCGIAAVTGPSPPLKLRESMCRLPCMPVSNRLLRTRSKLNEKEKGALLRLVGHIRPRLSADSAAYSLHASFLGPKQWLHGDYKS
eukprot:TRINITY_DN106508_c0_g1_i1.p2 TRINITY_DN106508_c0_g1~~TRINITY_DN106508_c0_g1_i1.p2  ORF type:complete len:121 (+),score=5.30 TRINITY_DN106508_c0_g1_i1:918-1280(+)